MEDIDSEWVNAGDQHVDPEIKLQPIDQQGIGNIPTDNA
jgi:hypothetical protein